MRLDGIISPFNLPELSHKLHHTRWFSRYRSTGCILRARSVLTCLVECLVQFHQIVNGALVPVPGIN